jgi:hypothetical protein
MQHRHFAPTKPLTAEQQREARLIVIKAQARWGSLLQASPQVGLPVPILGSIASGSARPSHTIYAMLKQYQQRQTEA